MPKTKDPMTIPEIVKEFEKHQLPAKIMGLKQMQEIVADEVLQAEQNVADYKKINGKQ
jgi:hypothetical protein